MSLALGSVSQIVREHGGSAVEARTRRGSTLLFFERQGGA